MGFRPRTLAPLGPVLAAAISAPFVPVTGCDPSDSPQPQLQLAADAAEFEPEPVPSRLSQTGLFVPGTTQPRSDLIRFSPQYPLWTDGAVKQRWIEIPPGTAVDASDPDEWDFPVGTRVWKEFAFDERRVETRFMERLPNGAWRYATYVWSDDQAEAWLSTTPREVETASGTHWVPGEADCRSCHEGRRSAVLGFDLLQLSDDVDALAVHGGRGVSGELRLRELVDRGLVVGLPDELVETAPRVVAQTPEERSVRGYFHGNCGYCHNVEGPLAPLGLDLSYRSTDARGRATWESTVGHPSRFRLEHPVAADLRIVAGEPDASVLSRRMHSRDPLTQMPPLGSRVIDSEALDLVDGWIESLVKPPSEIRENRHHDEI